MPGLVCPVTDPLTFSESGGSSRKACLAGSVTGHTGVDRHLHALYICDMSDDNRTDKTGRDLDRLEAKVEELIRACASLKQENSSLRTRQDNLVAERASLIEKAELARSRVEAMIARLKSMETNS